MADPGIVTCPTCGAQFDYGEMPPREPDDQANTQVDWLVSGRCPHCDNTVSMSFDQLKEVIASLPDDDED